MNELSSRPKPNVGLAGSRLSELLGDGDNAGFAQVTTERAFEFPADHGPHPAYRNEWWYVTGNLDGPAAERFGFELTFFRFSLTPDFQITHESAWRTNQIYVAHFAVTDVEHDEFRYTDRFARGALELAGAQSDPFRVWLDDWSIAAADHEQSEPHWRIQATDSDFSIDLELVASKGPVLNGVNGLSQKSGERGNASYYYSMTRLDSEGEIRVGDREYPVTGLAWLDREWGSSALSSTQSGWDWFALQLSDGSDLMFYNIRGNDGKADEHSAGSWTDRAGVVTNISGDEVELTVDAEWQSKRGGTYPAAWSITIPRLEMVLQVQPVLDDQELITNVRYWEGAVDVAGISNGKNVTGRGYVELTGYAE